MADGCHLEKMDKLLYFKNGLTDIYEILHDFARWRMAAIFEIVKCDISATI